MFTNDIIINVIKLIIAIIIVVIMVTSPGPRRTARPGARRDDDMYGMMMTMTMTT